MGNLDEIPFRAMTRKTRSGQFAVIPDPTILFVLKSKNDKILPKNLVKLCNLYFNIKITVYNIGYNHFR